MIPNEVELFPSELQVASVGHECSPSALGYRKRLNKTKLTIDYEADKRHEKWVVVG